MTNGTILFAGRRLSAAAGVAAAAAGAPPGVKSTIAPTVLPSRARPRELRGQYLSYERCHFTHFGSDLGLLAYNLCVIRG